MAELITITPIYHHNLVNMNEGVRSPIALLRCLVEHCKEFDLPVDDSKPLTSTPIRQRQRPKDHMDLLISIITVATTCVSQEATEDDDVIIKDLLSHKCPQHKFFSQVFKKADKDLPSGVMATYCDVAVVKFLSNCNGFSSSDEVEWSLQYFIKMFARLDPELQKSGSGWYNAKIKLRKASSIQYAPNLSSLNDDAARTLSAPVGVPSRRKSGLVDHNKLDWSQLNTGTHSPEPQPHPLDNIVVNAAASSLTVNPGARKRPSTVRIPSMITITEEPPDIIKSSNVETSAVVRWSPDLTEQCDLNDPLVCMPQPDSPTSPSGDMQLDSPQHHKSVRFHSPDDSEDELDLVELELQSGVNREGRIGLIAILHAIAKLPVKITGNVLYDDNTVWTKSVCDKVFRLIQKCLNSCNHSDGDDSKSGSASTASSKRRAYQQQVRNSRQNSQQKNPLAIYSSQVLQRVFLVLVQCGLYTRCTTQGNGECYRRVYNKNHSELSNELRNKLRTIFTAAGAAIKQYVKEFIKKESVEKVLLFLHSVLGYCKSPQHDDNLGDWFEVKVKLVAFALKSLVDKIMCLDMAESAIKKSITYEACQFITYSLELLDEDTFSRVHGDYSSVSDDLRKYCMYTQRLVMSSVLPSRSALAEDVRNNDNVSSEFVIGASGLRLWNNLPIDEMKLHVERFVVLLHLSEPGKIPSPGLLASIIDMTGVPVIVRGAVLFECAVFVSRIRSGWVPVSVELNGPEGYRNVLLNFKRWGEAITDKLEQLEGSDYAKRKEEEPILLKGNTKSHHHHHRVSFSLKMMTCQLLIEITRLLRDPPSQYNPFLPLTTSPTSTLQNTPRPSNVTVPVDLPDSEDGVLRKSLDHPRSSAGSIDRGPLHMHGRSGSLEVPRNPLSDQSGDSGGEEIHINRKSSADTVLLAEITHFSSLKVPNTLSIKGPDFVTPSIVIGSPNPLESSQRRLSLRRDSLDPVMKSRGSPGITDRSPTSYLQRKLSNFRESFRKVRNVTKRSSRKTAVTSNPASYPARTPGHSAQIRPSLSVGSSFKSLSDDPLCTDLPWIDVISRLYHVDMFQPNDDSFSLHKVHCAELVAALRRLYTLPPLEADSEDTASTIQQYNTFSLGSDELAYLQSISMGHTLPSFTSNSIASSSTFSFHRFSRGTSLNFGSLFSRRQSAPVTAATAIHRDSEPHVERMGSTSSNKMFSETELFGDDVDGALERHAMMLQSSRVKANDGKKIEYLHKEVKGLLHCPLTIIQLILAANLVEATKVPTLRDISWQLLLDSNQDLVQSAAMTFLWTVEKSNRFEFDKFFNLNVVIESSITEKHKSIMRFMILWRYRHSGSLNEKDAIKRLKTKVGSIGYALPSPLVGSPLSEIPVAPWEPFSVCTADNCEANSARCHKPTRLVPKLFHLKELKQLSQPFFVSGISVAKKSIQELMRSLSDADPNTANAATDVTTTETALFPSALLCFLQFLIDSVTTTDPGNGPLHATQLPSTLVSDAARMALWTCMSEDHELFFQPFLECFKKESMNKQTQEQFPVDLTNHSQLENVLHSLRSLLLVFPRLPPEAAQHLFNHLIGIVMQHKLQPYSCSNVLISEVLVLLRRVSTSVQGLDCKILKNVFKKEKCYNTIMTTANLQAVQGISFYVRVKFDPEHGRKHRQADYHPPMRSFPVNATTTFRDLTDSAVKTFRSFIMTDSIKWDNCILVDEASKQPMLDDLYIQDHYYSSVRRDDHPEDNRSIVFRLQLCSRADKMSFERRSLFWYKMGELSRTVLSIKLLDVGPSHSASSGKSSVTSVPHYQFMHNELSELGSFPRKALDNILHLQGSISPSVELRITDIMLKGVWVEFMRRLFEKMPDDYGWSHEIILFLSVVTGSLFLHADDAIILHKCCKTLLKAAKKFNNIFKQNGYSTIVPMLAQVYALHHHNKLVLREIEHMWEQFYILDENVFVMQAVTSLAGLLSSKANSLEGNPRLTVSKSQDLSLQHVFVEIHNTQYVKAIFQLVQSLKTKSSTPNDAQLVHTSTSSGQLEFLCTLFDLCIAVAGAHPESLRGMQMMVFLDFHMMLFLREFDNVLPERWSKHLLGIKALVKGADGLIKMFRAQQKKGAPVATGLIHQDSNVAPLSTTFSFLFHPLASLNTAIKNVVSKAEEETGGNDGLYRRDLIEANWKRTQISSICLLSLCSKFLNHLSKPRRATFSRYSNTVQILTELFSSEIKLLTSSNEVSLSSDNKGLVLFMTQFLPALNWAEERSLHPSFASILKFVGKLFRKFQSGDTPRDETWEVLIVWMDAIASCLKAQELAISQNKTVKSFIDSVTGIGGQGDGTVSEKYLESWPWKFSKSFVTIIYQMISYDIENISYLSQMDITKGKTASLFFRTILTPFCIEYGQHECLNSAKLMYSTLDIIETHLRSKAPSLQCGLRALNVFALSFTKLLRYVDWHRISLILIHLTQKKCSLPHQTSALHNPMPVMAPRNSKQLLETLQSIIDFSSTLCHQTPLVWLLRSLLTQVETKLLGLQALCTQEPMASEIAAILDVCRSVMSSPQSQQSHSSTTALLNKEDNLMSTPCEMAQISIGAPETSNKVNKITRRKRTKVVRMNSGKHKTSLELIREQEDEVDHKLSSVVQTDNVAGTVEQHRRSPRRNLPRQVELNVSDSDEDGDDDNIKFTLDTKPLANKKKTRTPRNAKLLAIHKKGSEDYDGDYEDEVATPGVVDINPTRHFIHKTAIVEVHNPLSSNFSNSRDVNSVSSNEGTNDRVKLLSGSSPTSPLGHHSVPSLHHYTLLDMSPRHHKSEGALKRPKFTFPDDLSNNESTV